ncbi:MAG: transporter substrate-binding domain-containing protein [Bermanella sp.]
MKPSNSLLHLSIVLCAVFASSFWVALAISQEKSEPPPSLFQRLDNIKIKFTAEEQRWLEKNHTVHVRTGKAPPYSFFKEESLGISSDYLNAIANRAGFKLKYIPDISWPDALKYIKNRKKIDLLPALSETNQRRDYIVFTQAYLSSPRVIYTSEDNGYIFSLEDLANKTVSVERGYVLQKKLANEYPSIKLLITETTENALISLASGKADAYTGDLMAGTYIIKNKGLNNIKISAPAPFEDLTLAMGVRSDWPELASIINKVLTTFSHKEHVAIRDKWLAPIRYEYGISANDIFKWILGITSIALSIIVTILIWNKKLKISEDKLKQEVYIKNRFFSIIAHDLRSPFHTLLGFTQLISQSANTLSKEELVECAVQLNDQGNMVFELLQNLLEWSRLQMEGEKQEATTVQLAELTQEIIAILSFTASEKDISLVNNINNECAFADTNMVRTVMLNLITNSIKFSRAGGAVIISASNNANMVQVNVTDTGIGMSQDQAKKIFSLDHKVSTIGTAGERGTGLGIPLCKEMLERNKGKIWVESTIGEGAVFHFTLPIAPA